MTFVAVLLLVLSAIPALLFVRNSKLFQVARRVAEGGQVTVTPNPTRVSVLIPARNEQASIGAAIESILRSKHEAFELLVLDDHSDDETATIVERYAANDARVRLIRCGELPEGWNGKQHACWRLAEQASHPWLLFLDADVRLSSDAMERIVAEQQFRKAPLISGFPLQETGTIAERMLIPLMHYVLLGYLPIDRMRTSTETSLAAGCGQLFFAEREAYMACDGHSAIASSRHDGIMLPRAFRRKGFATDIFDAQDIARCRMYHSAAQVCRGLIKNATEGIASARLIVPFSVLLLGGSVAPAVFLIVAAGTSTSLIAKLIGVVALVLGWLPRVLAAKQFRQSWFGACVHPICVAWFVALQWYAFVLAALKIKTTWRGRV